MRLPKWVIKWIKDDFDYEKLELKCKQQEEEIIKLKSRINYMRYMALSEEERIWIENTLAIITWRTFWTFKDKEEFVESYLERKELLEWLDFLL